MPRPVMTGLSGNEMYCLHQKGLAPGDLIIGNSVFSMGLIGRQGAGLRILVGGEVKSITDVIHDGRQKSYDRLLQDAQRRGAVGATGVSTELMFHGTNIEFLSIGSALTPSAQAVAPGTPLAFTSSANGQELYCQLDCGFRPIKFVFGNVAYSIGVAGSIGGRLRGMRRGEVKQFSQIFNETRHRALERITAEARTAGANAVVGIKTNILPFGRMQEMIMIGTASRHESLPAAYSSSPITSDLTNEEMWNLIHLGYMPIKLVLGVSVYSLGIVGGVQSAFQKLRRGEIGPLTSLIFEARENALEHIRRDADACGADDVAGIKVNVYQLPNGMLEFMAIGTAVKKMDGVQTVSQTLLSQAVIRDRETFFNTAEQAVGTSLNQGTKPGPGAEKKNALVAANQPKDWLYYVKFTWKILRIFLPL